MGTGGKKVVLVTAAVIERDGRILICRRAPADGHAGRWEFPGGKQEPGETLQQCLQREIAEELAIVVAVDEPVGESMFDYGRGVIHLFAFRCNIVSGEPAPGGAHDLVSWVRPADLLTHDLLEADIPIATLLQTP